MRNSRCLSQIDLKKIHLHLLFLNVYNRFYPLRGLVVVTAIGVQCLNCTIARDRDRLNVLGVRRHKRFAFIDGINMVSHVLLCIFFLGHLYTNNHNYILNLDLDAYTHRRIQIIFF